MPRKRDKAELLEKIECAINESQKLIDVENIVKKTGSNWNTVLRYCLELVVPIPHLNYFLHLRAPRDYGAFFYEWDDVFLDLCDALLYITDFLIFADSLKCCLSSISQFSI